MIKSFSIQPKYKKENGIWVLDIDGITIADFGIVERSIVYIPPKQIGGNHRHPRMEVFIGIGQNLRLIWMEKENGRQETKMKELQLYLIPSNLPHAIINESETDIGLLIELADGPQYDVTSALVVEKES